MRRFLLAIFRLLSSYGLGIVTLFFLLVLTYLGTLEQIDHGLFATQQKYFNSLFLIHEINGMPILPLPGVYLLLVVLAVNMVFGALTRFRWGLRHAGIFVVHVGILLMLLGGFITYHFSTDGQITLYEGEQSGEFLSYYEWELVIADANANAMVIPGKEFTDLSGASSRTFHSPQLPFELTLSGFMPNSAPTSTSNGDESALAALPRDSQSERNVAGLQMRIQDSKRSTIDDAYLWGMAREPYKFEYEAKSWTIKLQRRRWQLPFTIAMDRFVRELHPGTAIPAAFSSDVTVLEPTGNQQIHISMNRPLRYKGFTLFQSSWGPTDAGPNEPLFSTLAVVRNPADQFPLYGFTVITLGLLFHFSHKLYLHLRSEAARA